MATIIFRGWNTDIKKVSFTNLLHEKANITLVEAKNIKDKVTDNEIVELDVLNDDIANVIIAESGKLGVVCELK